jgi:hypothetical protein
MEAFGPFTSKGFCFIDIATSRLSAGSDAVLSTFSNGEMNAKIYDDLLLRFCFDAPLDRRSALL